MKVCLCIFLNLLFHFTVLGMCVVFIGSAVASCAALESLYAVKVGVWRTGLHNLLAADVTP